MSKPITVTDQDFADNVLLSEKPVLVDFWATWCPPCKAIAPILEEIAEENGDKLTIAKIDVDENPGTVRDYKIMAMPTLLLFQGGKPVKEIVGARPKQSLLAEIADVL